MNDYNKKIKYATLGKWSLMKKLGSGATSRVYLGYNPTTHQQAAIKVLKRIDPKYLSVVKNEVQIQASLNHPNLLGVQELHESTVLIDAEDKVQTVTAVILDTAKGGDVLILIEKIGIFPERLARTYFHQLIDSLDYLHKSGFAHRDIKPENIMLDEDYCVKLADFGCAAKYIDRKAFKTAAGTSKYFPPEEHVGFTYEGPAADLFATAIVVFCMVIGHMPFGRAIESDSLYNMIIKGKAKSFWKAHEDILKERAGDKATISNDFKELMTKMFDFNPSKRMTIEDIKKNTWFNGPILTRSEIIKTIKAKKSH